MSALYQPSRIPPHTMFEETESAGLQQHATTVSNCALFQAHQSSFYLWYLVQVVNFTTSQCSSFSFFLSLAQLPPVSIVKALMKYGLSRLFYIDTVSVDDFRTVYDVDFYEFKEFCLRIEIYNLRISVTVWYGFLKENYRQVCIWFISVVLFPKYGVNCHVSDGNSEVTAPECRIGSGNNRVSVRVVTAQWSAGPGCVQWVHLLNWLTRRRL